MPFHLIWLFEESELLPYLVCSLHIFRLTDIPPKLRLKTLALPTPDIKAIFFFGQFREESFFYQIRDLFTNIQSVFKIHTPIGPMSKCFLKTGSMNIIQNACVSPRFRHFLFHFLFEIGNSPLLII
jgi:hypothetical protein